MSAEFHERRSQDVNRRANGWRWMALRSDRRQRHLRFAVTVTTAIGMERRKLSERFGGRRRRHRRQSDREDE